MAVIGRKTLKSSRERMRRIDRVFEWTARIMLISYFLFVMVSWLTYREAFRIDTVQVNGALTSNADAIKDVADRFLSEKLLWKIDRNNAVFYPKSNLASALLALDPHIKSVDMNVENKKDLEIRINEYQPANLWCGPDTLASTTDNCYLADSDGFVYAKSPAYSGYPFPVFHTNIAGSEEQGTPVGLSVLPADEFSKIAVMLRALKKEGVVVSEINQTDIGDYSFITDKSWVLLWASDQDPVKSANNLSLVLENMSKNGKLTTAPVSIDLRFGNKIFYR